MKSVIKVSLQVIAILCLAAILAVTIEAVFSTHIYLFGISYTFAVLAMFASSIWFVGDESGSDPSVAIFAAIAACLTFAAIVLLSTTIFAMADFVAILAALVVATIAAFSACASLLTSRVNRKVYAVFAGIFFAAMCVVPTVICFGL